MGAQTRTTTPIAHENRGKIPKILITPFARLRVINVRAPMTGFIAVEPIIQPILSNPHSVRLARRMGCFAVRGAHGVGFGVSPPIEQAALIM